MDNSEIYIIIAVFVLLFVILVWAGAKYTHDIKRRKREREERRAEWKRRMNETIGVKNTDRNVKDSADNPPSDNQ